MAMDNARTEWKWKTVCKLMLAACVASGCLLAGASAKAQVASATQGATPNSRLLSVEEGRTIADAARDQDQRTRGARDCSHLVHQAYLNAGFEYPYASSFELYTGDENFERVRHPQPGDLIVWPGHVGIVLEPLAHSFYSLVSTGPEAQNYEGQYWRSRGRPRFYRYKVEGTEILTAAKSPAPVRAPNSAKPHDVTQVIGERATVAASASDRPPKMAAEGAKVVNERPSSPAPPVAATPFEVPESIIIAAGSKPPTSSQVAEAISELSNASASVLRMDAPSKLVQPVVIFERFRVERLEIKRDHGWAHLQIDSRATITAGELDYKQRQEKVRWELRRTESGWEAVTPTNRTYVPNDVAVRHLAAQLAHLTETDGAAAHQEAVLRQESQLANLLSALLDNKAAAPSSSRKPQKRRPPASGAEKPEKPAESGGPS
jgi:outer membrane murein-binding lipoprotein Lpp